LRVFNSYRGLPQEAKYLIYSAALPFVAYGMFYTDIAFFLTSVQGLSIPVMGLIITVMGLSTFIASIPLGAAADKYGRKKLYIIGNIMASVIIAVFALTTNVAILLVAAVAEGISEAAFAASANALLAEKAQEDQRTSAYSLFGFVQSIAFGAGSLIIPVIVIFESFGFNNQEGHILLYIILAILSLGSTLFMLRVKEPRRVKRHGVSLLNLLPHKSTDPLLRYLFASGLVAVGAGLVVPLMTTWLELQYGISDTISGPILGISALVTGVATLAGPWLARRVGIVKAITITQGVSTIFMFATPFAFGFVWAGLTYTLRSFLINMSTPLEQSMIMGIVIEDERGAASGISSAIWSLPNALSTFVGAYLLSLGFLAAPFILSGIIYLVSIILFWYLFRNIK
jgi:MFS family permease